ncbi:MAG: SAM-dependent methyltransferase [Saprospiraceae bacterium]|nr:SAM-dependent methyltransferase [Saprospiraceae bacterium]
MLDKDYWKNRWQTSTTGWEVGAVTTPIREFVNHLVEKKTDKNCRILIPGAGSGHEAIYFYEQGFHNITVCDWAEEAFKTIKEKLPQLPDNQLVVSDFFDLVGVFDLIVEQTFFCAIDPTLRTQYAQKCSELLNKEGKVCGVLFGKEFDFQGPPFGGTEGEYRAYFNPYFEIEKMDICHNSIKPREGSELWINLRKK